MTCNIYTMKTGSLLFFLGYATLTFMWLEVNRLFFGAIADLVHAHNESLINDNEDESEYEMNDFKTL